MIADTPSAACISSTRGEALESPYVARISPAPLTSEASAGSAISASTSDTTPASPAPEATEIAARTELRLGSACGPCLPVPAFVRKNTGRSMPASSCTFRIASAAEGSKLLKKALLALPCCSTHMDTALMSRSTSSGGGTALSMNLSSRFSPRSGGSSFSTSSSVGSLSSCAQSHGSSGKQTSGLGTPSKARISPEAPGEGAAVRRSHIGPAARNSARLRLRTSCLTSPRPSSRPSPCTSERITTWSSCHTTGTPSLVTWTSSSTHSAPLACAMRNDASVFSRTAYDDADVPVLPPPPRWPTTVGTGPLMPGKLDRKRADGTLAEVAAPLAAAPALLPLPPASAPASLSGWCHASSPPRPLGEAALEAPSAARDIPWGCAPPAASAGVACDPLGLDQPTPPSGCCSRSCSSDRPCTAHEARGRTWKWSSTVGSTSTDVAGADSSPAPAEAPLSSSTVGSPALPSPATGFTVVNTTSHVSWGAASPRRRTAARSFPSSASTADTACR
mmetsp:Transcript_19896/g.67799  ORF Transcript_19896/g.67799 Transcript_19896/m.67799 type:complete len:506 (+) Transcript_19896:1284-2801(+)